jgi:predicted ATPase/DNA-binding SARP family transcriptional activator
VKCYNEPRSKNPKLPHYRPVSVGGGKEMAGLSLFLLGGFEARLDEIPISGFKTDKSRALLAYLAVEQARPHRRQALAGLFWPGYLESSARANLRHALANLRQVLLDDQADPPFLLIEGETIQLNRDADVWVDVREFEQGIGDKGSTVNGRSLPAMTDGISDLQSSIYNQQSSISNLQSAISLYRGAFLEGFSLHDCPEFDTWSSVVREGLQRQALSALSQLAEAYESREELEEASQYARRQLELEPWLEEAHRQLMRLLARRGQRAAALVQYEACRRGLMAELGVEPSAETTELYEQIRAGEVGKAAAVTKKSPTPQEGLLTFADQSKPKHNLPVQLTRLIGREKEVSQVKALLENHRLVTLTGAGGVGKTRLSIQVGEELLERFTDGVWFVELAPLSDPEQVPSTVARALGAREDATRPMMDGLTFFIQRRKLFLVLDNCEHLLQACGNLADSLLRLCPALKMIVSSREPLGVAGEAIYRVPSLSYPETPKAVAAEELMGYSAVGLLVDRVQLLLPDYQVTGHNAAALARICQQLNGIPLALELAAARFGVLTAEQVADRLEDAFRILTSSGRTALPRHQTLRATIDWSYSLLDKNERLLLHRLTAFAGGFTLEAAEAVCAGEGLEKCEVLDLLTALVNKSLVVANRQQGEETRYQLLETVRQYAREKLLAAGESQWLSNRHCDYYVWLAEQAEPRLKSGERLIWTHKLILEHHNTHQALVWAFSQGDPHAGLRISVALAERFWDPVTAYIYGSEWVRRGIELAQSDPNVSRLMLVHLLNNELVSTKDISDEIMALCEQIGPQADTEFCVALIKKQFISSEVWNEAAMRRYLKQCLEAVRRLDPADNWNKAFALIWIAWAYSGGLEEHTTARQLALEAWRLFQQAGDRWYVTHLFILGYAAECEGDYPKARQYYQEAYSIFKEVNDTHGMGLSLLYLGNLELASDPYHAKYYLKEVIKLQYDASQSEDSVALYNLGAAEVMLCQSFPLAERKVWLRRAARLFGAAEALGPFWQGSHIIMKHSPPALALLRSQLEADELAAAWAEGAAMPVAEVYKYALEEDDPTYGPAENI